LFVSNDLEAEYFSHKTNLNQRLYLGYDRLTVRHRT